MHNDNRANERRAMKNELYQTGDKAEELARIIATQLSPSELDVVYNFALSLNVKTSTGGRPTERAALWRRSLAKTWDFLR